MTFSTVDLEQAARRFQADGYIKLPQLLTPTILHRLSAEVERLTQGVQKLPASWVWFAPSAAGGELVHRICRVNEYSPMVAHFGHSSSILLRFAKRLLGVSHVALADGTLGDYGAMLLIKDPDNLDPRRELGWHQDTQFTSSFPIHPFLNVGLYLDAADEATGQLVVLPGSHNQHSARFDQQLADTVAYHPDEVGLIAQAGDVVIHSSQLWHCSRHYTSARRGQRRIIYFKYYPAPQPEQT